MFFFEVLFDERSGDLMNLFRVHEDFLLLSDEMVTGKLAKRDAHHFWWLFEIRRSQTGEYTNHVMTGLSVRDIFICPRREFKETGLTIDVLRLKPSGSNRYSEFSFLLVSQRLHVHRGYDYESRHMLKVLRLEICSSREIFRPLVKASDRLIGNSSRMIATTAFTDRESYITDDLVWFVQNQ